MSKPRLFATFTPEQWIHDEAVCCAPSTKVDVTDVVLRLASDHISEVLTNGLSGSQLEDDIEDMLLLENETMRRHAVEHCAPYSFVVDTLDVAHFFRVHGFDVDASLQKKDEKMRSLRKEYGVRDPIPLPNGDLAWPTGSENEPRIRGFVEVSLDEMVGLELEVLLDTLSERMTGSDTLLDIKFTAIRASGEKVMLEVDGDPWLIEAEMSADYDPSTNRMSP